MTKQILINEDGRNNFDSKIKKEINLLKQEKNFLLIDYLTIMILGLTGVGKSTMVNFLLKLKKPDATEVNYWGIQTTEASIYKSDKEKNLVQNIMKTLNTINTYKKINHILVIIVLTK